MKIGNIIKPEIAQKLGFRKEKMYEDDGGWSQATDARGRKLKRCYSCHGFFHGSRTDMYCRECKRDYDLK